jgi:hypothetical protein
MIDVKATAITGLVTIGVIIAAWLVEIGGATTAAPMGCWAPSPAPPAS